MEAQVDNLHPPCVDYCGNFTDTQSMIKETREWQSIPLAKRRQYQIINWNTLENKDFSE